MKKETVCRSIVRPPQRGGLTRAPILVFISWMATRTAPISTQWKLIGIGTGFARPGDFAAASSRSASSMVPAIGGVEARERRWSSAAGPATPQGRCKASTPGPNAKYPISRCYGYHRDQPCGMAEAKSPGHRARSASRASFGIRFPSSACPQLRLLNRLAF
jgi:hypothetical protein